MMTAATGGLLLLGFGFSLMSLGEVFYFTCVRWTYYFNRKKRSDEAPLFTQRLNRRPLPNNNIAVRHGNDPEVWKIIDNGPPLPQIRNVMNADPVNKSRSSVSTATKKDADIFGSYID